MLRRHRPLLVAILGCVLLGVMMGTAGAVSHRRPAVSVSPSAAGPHGHYTVSFRAPSAAGRTATAQTSYVISAATQAHSGCQSSLTRTITLARAGQSEHVRLAASGTTAKLCAGTYHGTVMLISMPVCGPPTMACPQYVILGRKVGTFRFRVK